MPIWFLVASKLFDASIWPPKGGFSTTFNIVIYLNFLILLLVVPGIPVPRRVMKMVIFFGNFAYTVYLVHYPILRILRDMDILSRGWKAVLIASAISLVLAWLISLHLNSATAIYETASGVS